MKSDITDNESAKLLSSHGVIQGYNGIATVDEHHQIVVDTQAFGDVHEAAHVKEIIDSISDKRIVSVGEDSITFAYNDTKTGVEKLMSLKPFEFIRRFLEHVLPKGFMKIRYFGFLHTPPQTSRSNSPSPSLKRQRQCVRQLTVQVHRRARRQLPFVPVVPARATCFPSHRLPLGFIPGSHSPRTRAYEPSARTQHELQFRHRRPLR